MVKLSPVWHTLADSTWDFACATSLIGIWPRFVETTRLSISKLQLPIAGLPRALEGFTVLQLSDLHFQPRTSPNFVKTLLNAIQSLKADLIVITGDFLCHSRCETKLLSQFLGSLSAPYGCYAVLGNHDYAQPVSLDEKGHYDVWQAKWPPLFKGIQRLFSHPRPSGHTTDQACAVPLHADLCHLLQRHSIHLLHNETQLVPIKDSALNISGLGEYILGRCDPTLAFKTYQSAYPGIVLTHNPDSLRLLDQTPGSLILSGHTHGGTVNLPWIWKKCTNVENMHYGQGGLYALKPESAKWLYVSRGLGGLIPFRLRAPPELVHFTLRMS